MNIHNLQESMMPIHGTFYQEVYGNDVTSEFLYMLAKWFSAGKV